MQDIRSGSFLSMDHKDALNLRFSLEEIRLPYGVLWRIKPLALMGIVVSSIKLFRP